MASTPRPLCRGRTIAIAIVIVIIGGLASWQGYRFFAGASVAFDTVRRGDLVETVVASGHVETPCRVEIGSQMTGSVASVGVRALMGPSRSGQSTFLNRIGLLDRPTSGQIFSNGEDTTRLNDAEITRLRGH